MATARRGFVVGCLTAFTLLVAVVAVAVGAAFAFREQVVQYQARQLRPPAIAHGLQASYDWQLATLDGEPVPMTRFEGKPLFLHFWSPSCTPCLAGAAGIGRLHDKLRDHDIAFVCVVLARAEEAPAAAKTYGLTAPLYVPDGPRPEPFHDTTVPTTHLIAPDGAILHIQRGGAQWDTPAVEALLLDLADTARP